MITLSIIGIIMLISGILMYRHESRRHIFKQRAGIMVPAFMFMIFGGAIIGVCGLFFLAMSGLP